jgi:hypothetical protein
MAPTGQPWCRTDLRPSANLKFSTLQERVFILIGYLLEKIYRLG